jgi:hypothetical protein
MNITAKILLFIAATLLGLGLAAYADKEESVELADVPNVVQAAVTNLINGITLTSAEKEVKKDGRIVWEIEGTVAGLVLEIEVSDAGKILEIETEDRDDDDDDDDEDDDDDD